MHIAICDDHIADRKQLERLLKRESDRLLHTHGVLYIDSFGNEESILQAPMQYDLFLVDMTAEDQNGFDIAYKLRSLGVSAPIVHLTKPLRCEELSQIIEDARVQKAAQKPTVEIREEIETFYVSPEEITYAMENDYVVDVHMTDGRILHMLGTITDLGVLLENYSVFFITRKKYIVNSLFVSLIKSKEVLMKDGISIPLAFGEAKQIKNFLLKEGISF